MDNKFFKILAGVAIITSTLLGSEKSANAVTQESCPEGDQLTGWNQKLWLFYGEYEWFKTKCDYRTPYYNDNGNMPVKAHFVDINGQEFAGSATVNVYSKGWQEAIAPDTGHQSWACNVFSWGYFTDPKATYEDGQLTSCQYKICTSNKPCAGPGTGTCIPERCYSPGGNSTITLTFDEMNRSVQKSSEVKQKQLEQKQPRQEPLKQEQMSEEQLKQERVRQLQLREEQLKQEQMRQEQVRQEQQKQEQLREEPRR